MRVWDLNKVISTSLYQSGNQRAIDFVLSPTNQQLFASANQNLVKNVLQQPVLHYCHPKMYQINFARMCFSTFAIMST